MHKVIISDTSCLIILTKIGELDLLRDLYQSVTITNTIFFEFGNELPDWIQIENASDEFKQQLLEIQVDPGEASAIALALEMTDPILILDDWKARKVAERLWLPVTGTLGVIIKPRIQELSHQLNQ